MTRQTNGWQAKSLKADHNARKARQAEIARLKRERVDGSEHTPAELLALHRQLKTDYLAREARRRTTA